jgi:tRNA(fMet)-specific endonuclease VapC
MLDSNAVIQVFKGHPGIVTRIEQGKELDFGISAIVLHELYYGAFKSSRTAGNVARVDQLRFAVVDFDLEDARMAGEVRAALAASGTPIGPHDVLIAGQALARDLALVTHNLREFARVSGLRLEDRET